MRRRFDEEISNRPNCDRGVGVETQCREDVAAPRFRGYEPAKRSSRQTRIGGSAVAVAHAHDLAAGWPARSARGGIGADTESESQGERAGRSIWSIVRAHGGNYGTNAGVHEANMVSGL
jgi:hypothetical protein